MLAVLRRLRHATVPPRLDWPFSVPPPHAVLVQAAARAEVEVAAALRAGQAPDESDDDDEDAGGAAAHKQGGAAPSVLLKVRASDGSLERFKVRCVSWQ